MFVSVGANRQPSCADSSRGLVAFGTGIHVALWSKDHDENGISALLAGHTGLVTVVRILDQMIFSAGEDGFVRVWSTEGKPLGAARAHEGSVTCLSGDSMGTLVSCGTDKMLVRWRIGQDGSLTKAHEENIPFLPNCVSAIKFANCSMVAIGGACATVHVVVWDDATHARNTCMLRGHEDWIRTMDTVQNPDNSYVLATGGQDKYIRLWRVSQSEQQNDHSALSTKTYRVGSVRISLDVLILGHDDWVTSVCFDATGQELLSTSADSSLMLWRPDPACGVWVCVARLGDLAIKGGSTTSGASGGFYAGIYMHTADNRAYVGAIGRTGSWRVWQKLQDGMWVPEIAPTGHVRAISDLAWAPNGQYLLTCSLDQTTRLFAQANDRGHWLEVSRPQIHGYDMVCVAALNNHEFVSGGEEKTLRVFRMPQPVARDLEKVTGSPPVCDPQTTNNLPQHTAAVPALGLSNSLGEVVSSSSSESHVTPSAHDTVGLEDQLQRLTLWPEIYKLYGHGYECVACAVSHSSTLVASTCRSNTETHAVVRLYSTSSWQEVCSPLQKHSLTVTRVCFADKSDTLLLTVSRDRTYCLWALCDDGQNWHVIRQVAAHTRIIWDACWVSSCVFLTASRDSTIKAWNIASSKEIACLQAAGPVTAVAYRKSDGKLAFGLDSGHVYCVTVCLRAEDDENLSFAADMELVEDRIRGRINKLSFRPISNELAIGSNSALIIVLI